MGTCCSMIFSSLPVKVDDNLGSVRVPAHFAGVYALKTSTGRWPKMGMKTSMAGQEGASPHSQDSACRRLTF